jgi:hypothetical protein
MSIKKPENLAPAPAKDMAKGKPSGLIIILLLAMASLSLAILS